MELRPRCCISLNKRSFEDPGSVGRGLDWGRLFYGCFKESGDEKEDFRCQNGAEEIPQNTKGNQKGANASQGTSKNTSWGTGAVKVRKSIQKGNVPWHEIGTIFENNRQKYHPEIIKNTISIPLTYPKHAGC